MQNDNKVLKREEQPKTKEKIRRFELNDLKL